MFSCSLVHLWATIGRRRGEKHDSGMLVIYFTMVQDMLFYFPVNKSSFLWGKWYTLVVVALLCLMLYIKGNSHRPDWLIKIQLTVSFLQQHSVAIHSYGAEDWQPKSVFLVFVMKIDWLLDSHEIWLTTDYNSGAHQADRHTHYSCK